MRRASMVGRLAAWFALCSLLVFSAVGWALFRVLEVQLSLRDDAALLTRVEQIRTLVRDVDALPLIHSKPELFANMLGNREALLILRFPGQAPLLEINPDRIALPVRVPVAAHQPLGLEAIDHLERGAVPFIAMAALARTGAPGRELEIVAGRLMSERTRLLHAYLGRIVLAAALGAALAAVLAYFIARAGLRPLGWLARRTAEVGIDNLALRIDPARAPAELLPLIRSFNAMLERLEHNVARISQVSADMAHDLRTPVGILMGQIEVALAQPRDGAYYVELLGSNFEQLQRLRQMTDNMLFLARADHGALALARVALDVQEEFDRLCDYFEGPAEERGLRLAALGQGRVWADPDLLRRALANLLANALRYADAGSEVRLTCVQQGTHVVLGVENQGPAIPPAEFERLFDRFYRSDPSRLASGGNSGLGLSIVRSIAQAHEGSVGVHCAGGRTSFTISFPCPAAA